jgi:hypothetical protein
LTNLTVRGHDFTPLTQTVCSWWPDSFGAFPAESADELKSLLAKIFDEGGVYDSITEAFNKPNPVYCLRKEVSRVKLTVEAKAKSCPATVDSLLLEEMVIDGTDSPLTKGFWACSNSSVDQCDCSRRDKRDVPNVAIKARATNCKMVHNSECYGDCPPGYRPTFLKGWFRPVCTSVCAESNHPFSCGLGCANSRFNCARVILGQVGEIAIAASRVASFFSGTAAISETVVAVKKVAEFALTIMKKIADIADIVFARVLREKVELTLLLSLFQYVKEEAEAFKDDWLNFQTLIKTATTFFLQLLDAELGWKSLNIQWIAGAIMDNGDTVLDHAFTIAKQFAYKECALADNTVIFSIEESGDQRILGPWAENGEVASKPRYRLILNKKNVMMEWSGSSKKWGIWVMDRTFGRGWWWGWLGFGWRELYNNGQNTAAFPSKGWNRKEGATPAPELVGAQNGGV